MKKIIIILLSLSLVLPLISCGSSSSDDSDMEKAAVWTIVQECVTKNLKSPSTAKFPTYNYATIKLTDSNNGDIKEKWHVESYVDAQNGFGATIRQNFRIDIIIHQDDTVTYEHLKFN